MEDTERAIACARYLKGLSDPSRLRIVDCLRDKPRSVGEIADEVQDNLANVSHHLRTLKNTGLVCADRAGQFIVYRLNPEVFRRDKKGAIPQFLEMGCCRLELTRRMP
jgi:DNA-binding transcriptional ArsR family regulator